jgi:hypothetical protein
MTEKRFTIEEMQNWSKRFKISTEDETRVIDTYDDGEYWTVHSNESYNLCIQLNALHEENLNLKQALWEAEEECLCESYRDNPIRLEDKMMNLKEEWDREYWNDIRTGINN